MAAHCVLRKSRLSNLKLKTSQISRHFALKKLAATGKKP